MEAAIVFNANGWHVPLTHEWVARLSDLLDELSENGVRGAAGARSRFDHVIEGGLDGLEWHPEEKDALTAAIYKWMDDDGYPSVPELVRSDLRYALFGEWQDDLRGTFLLELERDGAVTEVPKEMNRAPAKGQALTVNGESWIVSAVAPLGVGNTYVATVRASWHPG